MERVAIPYPAAGRQRIIQCFVFLCVFILYTSTGFSQTAEYTWNHLKIGGGGYVTGMVVHPNDKNTLYVRTDVGGAYRWDPKNKVWVQMLDWVGPDKANLIGVDGIALDPGNPERIYLALGKRIGEPGGIYRSEDRGMTWTKLLSVAYEGNGRTGRWIGECLAVDPNSGQTIYAGTRKEGLFRSLDDGKTWLHVADIPDATASDDPNGLRIVVFDPSVKQNGKSALIYAGVPGRGIFLSKDGGDSFTLMKGSPKNPARMQVVNKCLFVTHGEGVALWADQKWQDISPLADTNYVALAVDPVNEYKIVVAQRRSSFSNEIYRSEDRGKTWQQINSKVSPVRLHLSIPWWPERWFSSATSSMVMMPDRSGEVLFTDWFGVWQTKDIWADTTDWTTLVNGHEETVVLTLVSPPKGALVYSGMADVFGFKHSSLQAYPEKRLYSSNEGFSISVCEKDPANIAMLVCKSWYGDDSKLICSGDYGETWISRHLPEGEKLGRIAMSAIDPDIMVYLAGSGKAYYSRDGAISWSRCTGLPDNIILHKDIWDRSNILTSDLSYGHFYLFKDGILYTSIDGGASWKEKTTTPLPRIKGTVNIVAVPGLSKEVWASLDQNGLWRSADGGATFHKINAFSISKAFSCGAPEVGSNSPTAYCYGMMKGKWGLYRSTDNGKHWVKLNDERQQFPAGVKCIAADRQVFGRIYLGTGGYGILYGEKK